MVSQLVSPRKNLCLLSTTICSLSGRNLFIIYSYVSRFISRLVTIVQALLSLGSDMFNKMLKHTILFINTSLLNTTKYSKKILK